MMKHILRENEEHMSKYIFHQVFSQWPRDLPGVFRAPSGMFSKQLAAIIDFYDMSLFRIQNDKCGSTFGSKVKEGTWLWKTPMLRRNFSEMFGQILGAE